MVHMVGRHDRCFPTNMHYAALLTGVCAKREKQLHMQRHKTDAERQPELNAKRTAAPQEGHKPQRRQPAGT